MKFNEVFNAVKEEFGEEIAILVLSINAIHRSMKVKLSDLKDIGIFSSRLREKVDNVMWDEDKKDVELSFRIALKLNRYEYIKILDSTTGKTLKELIEEVPS